MAVGLSPENWALLALCGVFLGLASSLFAIEPGFLLMPLLAILLPRLGVPAEATVPVAIATALALLVPLSIARLQPLHGLSADMSRGFRPPFWLGPSSAQASCLLFQDPGCSPGSR